MPKYSSKAPRYQFAVRWIAFNDEAVERDPAVMAGLISVLLVSDTFEVPAEQVAKDVVTYRAWLDETYGWED